MNNNKKQNLMKKEPQKSIIEYNEFSFISRNNGIIY